MRSTFKVLFFLKRDSQKANGKVPIFCRITVSGKEARFSIKQDVDPAIWSVKDCKAIGRTAEALQINEFIEKIKASFPQFDLLHCLV